MSNDDRTIRPPLEYGRAKPRIRRRWILLPVCVVAIALFVWLGWERLDLYLRRRAGFAQVNTWRQAARTFVVPPGTLMFSEDAGDIDAARKAKAPELVSSSQIGQPVRWYLTYDRKFPLLRHMGYTAGGVPNLYPFQVLYVHEHPRWTTPNGAAPFLYAVRFLDLDAQGRPSFSVMAWGQWLPKLDGFESSGGTATVRIVPTRSLKNLRIFAGEPNADDPTRFALPFTCDGGAGRFEFQTDIDVSDGGKLVPDVRIEWGDATTSPTTRVTGFHPAFSSAALP